MAEEKKTTYNQRMNKYTQEYIRQNYDQLSIRLPKEGEITRAKIAEAASSIGMSTNAFMGEAIIIRIEPEVLLSLDLDSLFQDRKKDHTLSAEELEEFLHVSPKQTLEMGESTLHSGDTNDNGIERNLQNIHLSAERREELMQMIDSGASDEELMEMIGTGSDSGE